MIRSMTETGTEGSLMKETEMEGKVKLKAGERIDDLQLSGLKIIQDPSRFCFGMDAVLLSGFVKAKEGANILDIGTGTGILPLLLSAKTKAAHITGLEIQEESAEMAERSLKLNSDILNGRLDIVRGDIKEAGKLFAPASFEVICCNPPYKKAGSGIINPHDAKAVARHEIYCTFDDIAKQAYMLLKGGGKLFIVHRPERLPELCITLSQRRLEVKRMRFVYPFADREPEMVLIEAAKDGKSGMKAEKPLIIYESEGVYSAEIKRDYGF